MTKAVIDASALIEVLIRPTPAADLRKRVLTSTLYAPEVLWLEVLGVTSRMLRHGLVDGEQADRAIGWLINAPITESSHRPLVNRAWELRHSISPHDGAYVALAEELDIPLITCDAKLGGSNSHKAKIEVYPRS
ncbi:MAG TPA: type II toxin-antitoxin system VapC family toxin [Actinokineospora sp.]|jgi:predicted nucleic acid-binding protein|nr:type II toxin-antitoxin system VapC family toxin [Actinokineospora sp.]